MVDLPGMTQVSKSKLQATSESEKSGQEIYLSGRSLKPQASGGGGRAGIAEPQAAQPVVVPIYPAPTPTTCQV